tara:strand:- start:153 stop:1127 length:975 start_codon:yes stop_codon:yes gene_type:complete
MEQLKNQIMKGRNIKEVTWKQYKTNFKQLNERLNKDNELPIGECLHGKLGIEGITKYLEELKPAKQRMMISCILILLSPDGKGKTEYTKMHRYFTSMLSDKMTAYFAQQKEQLANPKQMENWRSWNDILKVQRGYMNTIRRCKYSKKDKLTKKEFHTLQKYLVSSLYTFVPPRRLDYANMKIVEYKKYKTMTDEETKASNYLVIQSRVKKYFSFGEYSQKTKQNFMMEVPSKLNQVLNLFLKYHTNKEYLLTNFRNGKLSSDGLSKLIMRIFGGDEQKNVSVNMLRHIFLSEKFKNAPSIKEKELLAMQMGHSSSIAEQVYTKK